MILHDPLGAELLSGLLICAYSHNCSMPMLVCFSSQFEVAPLILDGFCLQQVTLLYEVLMVGFQPFKLTFLNDMSP